MIKCACMKNEEIVSINFILSFTASSKCVVWDLRKNESIIKISDSSRALRYKPVAWHPEVATQLCLASEDDHSPVIQIWDLRMASAPLKTLGMYWRNKSICDLLIRWSRESCFHEF